MTDVIRRRNHTRLLVHTVILLLGLMLVITAKADTLNSGKVIYHMDMTHESTMAHHLPSGAQWVNQGPDGKHATKYPSNPIVLKHSTC